MGRLKDLEHRVAAVEDRVQGEAGLRASQDRDLSDIAETLRAQKRLIQALGTTQSEHTQKLNQHTQKLNQLDEKVSLLDEKVNQHTEILNQHTDVLDRHTEMLNQHGEMLERHDRSLSSAHGKLDHIITVLDRLVEPEES